MRALLILCFTFLPFTAIASDAECHIDSDIWFTTGADHYDEYLCDFDWAVADIVCTPSVTDAGVEHHHTVFVELVGEADTRLNSLEMRTDGNAQIFYEGAWRSLMWFARHLHNTPCITMALS